MKYDSGDLPIHVVIENVDDSSAKVISLLLGLYPSSLAEKGRHGLAPLNLAIKSSAHTAVTAAILEAYTFLEYDMKMTLIQLKVDDTNRLPLHIGALCGLSTLSLIDMMQSFPEAIRVRSTHAESMYYLPIDFAVNCRYEAEVIIAMLLLFPESAFCRISGGSMDALSAVAKLALNKPVAYWLQRRSTKGSLDLKVLQEVISDLRNESSGNYEFEKANDALNLVSTGNDVIECEDYSRLLPKDDDPPPSSLVDGAELSLFREMETLRRKLTDSDVSIDELRDEFDRFKVVMNEKLEVVERGTILAISTLRDDDLLA